MASVARKPLPNSTVDAFDDVDEPAAVPWPCTKTNIFLSGWRQNCPVRAGEALVVGWLTPTQFTAAKLRVYEKLVQGGTFHVVPLARDPRLAGGADLRRQFDDLVCIWLDETLSSSSIIEICTNWAYQRVIGLGPNAIPLILEAVNDGQRHWGWALAALTGDNPAADTQNQQDAADVWLRWAAQEGYLTRDPQRVD